MNYKLGSLFDGSGGFPLAGALCGIEPVWAAEVEPYPIAVTRSRFPKMKHLGDISKVNGAEIEPVDIITFGSPCQDLSVAGKRAGLKHTENGDEETTRSGLFMEAVRIIKEMRNATNGQYPTFALWENVPGAFSSNAGQDFRVVCEELIKIVEPSATMPSVPQKGWNYADSYVGDGWSLAYRVLDAQYWGVPQRRRRIYLVADFRGERAREVLFEREGLRGYFTQGTTPWQTTPADAQGSLGADDREGEGFDGYNGDLTGDKSATLGVNCGLSSGRNGIIERGGRQLDDVGVINAIGGNAENYSETKTLPTLTCSSAPGFNNAVAVPYTMKIRSGCEGGGKGALVQKDKSATLATNNDQYLFQPTGLDAYNQALTGDKAKTINSAASDADHVPCVVLDDQGGQQISVRHDGKVPTLRAEMHGNVPCVMESAGFCTEHSAKSRSIGFEKEVSPTLRAGVTPACVYSVENHPADSRVNLDESGKVQTLTSRMGTGGGNVPMVMEPKGVICLQGNGIDRADTAGCNGKGWKEDTAYTLNTIDRPAVAYSFDSLASNSMKSKNPYSGCREVEVAKTLDTTDPNPSKNQGGIAVVQQMPVFSINHQGGNTEQIIEEKTGTITAAVNSSGNNKLSVAYGLDRASFNQGQNAKFDFTVTEESQPTLTARGPGAVAQPVYNSSKASFFMRATENGPADTLVATDYKDPQLVAYQDKVGSLCASDHKGICNQDIDENKAIVQEMPHGSTHYIVRRLTPTECARLQGFADRWGDVDSVDKLSQKDYRFWLEVRNTHARINGKKEQDYTVKQMLTWYNKLQTDSAEYKMWGNGIALPTALYVLQGIAEALQAEETQIEDWML